MYHFETQRTSEAIRVQLPNSPRRTIACVYSKLSRQDKQEVDLFLQSLQPYDGIMWDYNDDIWSSDPTRPWQQDLANSVLGGSYPEAKAK